MDLPSSSKIPEDKRIRRRILSLDGGGTRGYLSLLILEKLEEKLKQNLKDKGLLEEAEEKKFTLTKYFDLICGTSTGGIIALALQQEKTIEDIKNLYKTLASKVFGGFMGTRIWHPWQIVTAVSTKFGAWYDASVLEELLKKEFGPKTMLWPKNTNPRLKVFVVATENTNNGPTEFLFRNYSAPMEYDTKSPGPLYTGSNDIEIWAAARASSAAPTYFSAFENKLKGSVTQELVDGGVLANNPTEIAWHEASLMWKDDVINLVVSIGTGYAGLKPKESNSMFTWAKKMATIATDSMRTARSFSRWRRMINSLRAQSPAPRPPRLLYRRLDPPAGSPYTERLDYWTQNTFNEWEGVMRADNTELNRGLNDIVKQIVDELEQEKKNKK